MGAVPEHYFEKPLTFRSDYEILIKISDASWSGIYCRHFLKQNCIWFDHQKCLNDTYFFYQCLVSAKCIFLIRERFVYYRINNPRSLIGIRADHFDCQIQLLFAVESVVKKCSHAVRCTVRRHLIQVVFYRYLQYSKDRRLGMDVKNNIRCLMRNFVARIEEEDVKDEYLWHYRDLLQDRRVSIIIPIYNAAPYLERCLDSLIHQTLSDIEIICVNDGSTDNSLDILTQYAAVDDRIVILNQLNAGSAAARNYGLTKARGQYIGFVDGDDYVDHNYYESLLHAALDNQADIAATSSCKLFDSSGILVQKDTGLNGVKLVCNIAQKGRVIISTGMSPNKIYRKRFLEQNNIRCLELRNAAENNYFTDISIICANKIAVVNDVTYYCRINQDSQTRVLKDERQFSVVEVYQAVDNFILALPISDQDKRQWLSIMIQRKKRDYGYFTASMTQSFLDSFYRKWITAFPELKKCIRNIVVSLTSYPERINTVHLTVASLLSQSMRANKVVLWLAPEQFPNGEKDLPADLLNLKARGLTVDWYHDIKSYKKLIPALKKYPEAVIVTADDDAIYHNEWLSRLYCSYLIRPHAIHCHRAHKIAIRGGVITPYREWTWYDRLYDQQVGYSIFPVGLGGILYPPHCLAETVLDEENFLSICPQADDMWFWASALLNKTRIILINKPFKEPKIIEGTQDVALWLTNLRQNQNDVQLQRLMTVYPQILFLLRKEQRLEWLKSFFLWPYSVIGKLGVRRRRLNQLTDNIIQQLNRYRLDIKNMGTAANAVAVTAPGAAITTPTWFTNAQGVGQIVISAALKDTLKIRVVNSGVLILYFRGEDKRYNGVRLPVQIDYQSIRINGQELVARSPIIVWYDKPYVYQMSVQDGQEITIQLKRRYHRYNKEEIRELIFKLASNLESVDLFDVDTSVKYYATKIKSLGI